MRHVYKVLSVMTAEQDKRNGRLSVGHLDVDTNLMDMTDKTVCTYLVNGTHPNDASVSQSEMAGLFCFLPVMNGPSCCNKIKQQEPNPKGSLCTRTTIVRGWIHMVGLLV